MRRNLGIVSLGCATFALIGILGCPQVFQRPVPINLVDFGLSEYPVEAGVPTQQKGTISSFNSPVAIGSGSLEIGLDAITVTPAVTSGGKVQVSQQGIDDCMSACNAIGVEADTCDQVCSENILQIRVTVGAVADITADCDNGETYTFLVQLDDEGVPTSISVSPSRLTAETRDLLNGGGFGICIEVLSPIDATVLIEELTFVVGL